MASTEFHEAEERLQQQTKEQHRAIVSLMEELEAVDWYAQRVDATGDEDLRAILAHNRDEEKEHAVMTLEWLRRHDPELDRFMRQYLFTEGSITEREEAATSGNGTGDGTGTSRSRSTLGIGSLRTRS